MAHKIRKSQLQKAWTQLGPEVERLPAETLSRLLTAATILGIAEHESRFEWVQPPPARTVLEYQQGNIYLTFGRDQDLSIGPAPDPSAQKQARSVLAKHPSWEPALQCLGLKALEGDIRWKVEPPFFASCK